jgi:3-oxoacyl-[acyl-carrier-protein] synthase II
MPQTTSARLEILEQNLRAIALIRDTLSASELDAQISQLLQEVLNEEEIVDPLVDSLDLGDEDQRIVITGIGLVTPYGVGIDPFWQGVSGGHSAIRPITHFDASAYPCRIAGEVPHFEAIDFLESREVRRLSRSSQFAVAAARMSVSHARLRIDHGNRDEIGTIIGCGTTSMPDFEQAMQTMLTRGPQRVSPFFIPAALPNMPASQVAIQLGLRGHTTAISTACAAGAQAIGEAAAVIQRGDAEIMLAGGSEAPIAAISLASFCAMRALSTRNDDPARASRPFDALRDGFVSGEGAGVLVLERLSSARRRGAPILAELLGYGCSCDAYHVTAPDPDGIGAVTW